MANANGHHEVHAFTNGAGDKKLKIDASTEGSFDNAGGSHVAPLIDGSVPGPSHNTFNGIPHPYGRSHNEEIVDYLYNVGFQHGEYADTLLHAHQNVYRLHAIILSRSPYLAHLIANSPKPGGMRTIYVPLENIPEISDEGFAVALGYLYSSHSLNMLSPNNARAVLAAANLLGGMDVLCHYAYQTCKNSININTINNWIQFVDRLSDSSETTASNANSRSATPSSSEQHQFMPVTPLDHTTTIFGPYASRLRGDVFEFLISLPQNLEMNFTSSDSSNHSHTEGRPGPTVGREVLLDIFSMVPFDMFKNAIESPSFLIGSDQERFKFAKAAIELRRRTRGNGVEETVVLAFGGESGRSAVHVTRKIRKRALFKVG